MKTCSSCKESKPESEYTRDRSRRDNLNLRCKVCEAAYRRGEMEARRRDAEPEHTPARKLLDASRVDWAYWQGRIEL